MMGGTYFLQGKLAQSVKTSIITGVCALVGVFSLILFIISRSFKLSFWVGLSALSLSLIVFGLLGVIKVPIDIISSPAINIALGIAVDSTIHITRSVRMKGSFVWSHWVEALKEQVKPACISMLTIITGFSVFSFSSFPPSQRFGGIVVLGTLLALPMALFMIPSLGSTLKSSEN